MSGVEFASALLTTVTVFGPSFVPAPRGEELLSIYHPVQPASTEVPLPKHFG